MASPLFLAGRQKLQAGYEHAKTKLLTSGAVARQLEVMIQFASGERP